MLQLKNVHFSYEKQPVLHDISLQVAQGEHLCIMGESGCGKSTLLKIIYGLLHVENGSLHYHQKPLLGPLHNLVPGEPFMKYVAQDFDLMPFISVEENIGKHLSNFFPEEKAQRTQELLEVIEMTAFAKTHAKNLSGGQQQRVALARALAKQPEVLLLDEPFSQIDNFKKNSFRRNLFSYLKKENITCIIATHDGNDALSFANRVVVLKEGNIIAEDLPKQLYKNPKERYVASLFGEVNEIQFTLNGKEETVLAYPHQLSISKDGNIAVTVTKNYFKGSHFLVEADHNGNALFFENLEELSAGEKVLLKLR